MYSESELRRQTFQIVFNCIFKAWILWASSVELQVAVFLQVTVLKWHSLDVEILMVFAENINCHENCISNEEWDNKDCDYPWK